MYMYMYIGNNSEVQFFLLKVCSWTDSSFCSPIWWH